MATDIRDVINNIILAQRRKLAVALQSTFLSMKLKKSCLIVLVSLEARSKNSASGH
jgi:hypothetical protein